MSRMATNEYIGAKRRLYATADRENRIKMLDEVCETTGYERKYANRLLTGSIFTPVAVFSILHNESAESADVTNIANADANATARNVQDCLCLM